MNEFIYGRHAVHHLMVAGRRRPLCLHLLRGLEKEKEEAGLVELARRLGVPVRPEESGFFSKKFGIQVTHQGIAVQTPPYPYVGAETLAQESLLLILDEIQDPQNLGALCRSAYLLGVGGVVIPETNASPISPGACHASVGAVEYLKIARVTSIAKYIELLKKDGFWTYGADQAGGRPLYDEKFPDKVAVVIGNEEKGIRRLVRERCDLLLNIPMARDRIDSLNASVSGGILLYEVVRQKLKKT